MDQSLVFVLCAAGTVVLQLVCFLIAYACEFDKITDFSGGMNFVLVAVLTLVITDTYTDRQLLVTGMVVLSRVELAIILLVRVLKRGKDKRFDKMRTKFFAFLGFWIFQMIWVFGVSVSVIYCNSTVDYMPPLEGRDWAGLAMFLVGFSVQVWADVHKYNFRANPANKGKLCRGGVWSWSRHPNYFGEILLWFGIFVSVTPLFDGPGMGAGWWTVTSPVLTFLILMFLSGMPIAERDSHRRYYTSGDPMGYAEYRRRTSILIPLPPPLYGILPAVVKAVLLFEWPMYNHGGPGERTHIAADTKSSNEGAVDAAAATAGDPSRR